MIVDTSAIVAIAASEPERIDFLQAMGKAAVRRIAYALVLAMDEPLLVKGDDFIHTNVRRVI